MSPIPTLTQPLEPGVYWVAEEQSWNVVPKHLGPTWQEDSAWDGENEGLRYVLPELTLGWQILKWIGENVKGDDVDIDGNRLPFVPTGEQSRFILWWYAIDESGRFAYRQGVLQRLKGWGRPR